MNDLFTLKEKVAVVTGAAQGIGREIAIGFSRYGAEVVGVDLNEEKLQEVKKEIESQNGRCLALKVDLGSVEEIRRMTETVVQQMGRIDILANIAGVNVHKPAEDMTEEEWDFVQDINLKSLFFCCQCVGKVMLEQGSGRIINMSSSFGLVGFAGRTAYASSKAGVTNLTKTLAIEWSAKGINVNAVAPCITETPTRRELLQRPGYKEWATGQMLPIGRWAQPGDFIGPTLFLCSSLSDMVVGHVLMVDGGWTIH